MAALRQNDQGGYSGQYRVSEAYANSQIDYGIRIHIIIDKIHAQRHAQGLNGEVRAALNRFSSGPSVARRLKNCGG